MNETVELKWDEANRHTPVRLVIRDGRRVDLEYKQATSAITEDNIDDAMASARNLMSQWARGAGRSLLAVSVYDLMESPAELTLYVCTADGDMALDEGASRDEHAAATATFNQWLSMNVPRTSRKQRRSQTVNASDLLPALEPEPELANQEPGLDGEEPLAEPLVDEEQNEPHRPELTGFTAREDGPALGHRVAPPRMEVSTVDEPAPTGRAFFETSIMDEGKNDGRATDGWQGLLNRVFRSKLAPSADEIRRRSWIESIAQGWDGTRYVAVLNTKGGANKTPTAITMAATAAEHSTMSVALLDNNEGAGNAYKRIDAVNPHRRTARHLADFAERSPMMSRAELEHHMLVPRHDRYQMLAAHQPNLTSPGLSRDEAGRVHDAVSRFYQLGVEDSGNSWETAVWRVMLERAGQLVVPLVTAPDRFDQAAQDLEMIRGFGPDYAQLAERAIIVVSQWQPGHQKLAQDYARRWEGKVGPVVVVPYDPHLASHDLRLDRLHRRTRDAFLELTARVAEGLRGELG